MSKGNNRRYYLHRKLKGKCVINPYRRKIVASYRAYEDAGKIGFYLKELQKTYGYSIQLTI